MKTFSNELVKIIDEAIDHELVISDLYLHFHRLFPEDRDFWWTMALEEKNHASILINIITLSKIVKKVPKSIIPRDPLSFKQEKERVAELVHTLDPNLTREKAFQMAYDTEISSGEEHYRLFVNNHSEQDVFKVFQQLSKQDNDHAARILEYALLHGIRIRHKEPA